MVKTSINDELKQLVDKDISYEELMDCINNSKISKAVAEDLIPNKFLRASSFEMLRAVLHLFNQCLLHGHIPGAPLWLLHYTRKGTPITQITTEQLQLQATWGSYSLVYYSRDL